MYTATSHTCLACLKKKKEGVENVYVHCFLDGRDTAPTSGKEFIEELEAKMKEIGVGKIASISDVTTQWIVITDGIVWRKHTKC